MIIILFAILFVITFILSYFYLIPLFYGAPYENSKEEQIKQIINFSKDSKYIAELGSGSGKIAIELSKLNKKIDCYEINPFLVLYLRYKIEKLKLKNVRVIWKNFFKINLSKYDTIIFFQFPTIIEKLEDKFKNELKKGTKIISNYWKLKKLKPKKESKNIFLYINNPQA